MDPNANLAEQRDIIERMLDPDSQHVDSGDAIRLAELQRDLDEWLAKGGFLPKRWDDSRQFGTLSPPIGVT